jgi:methylmalonyl-CoA/ethylmalonyl-CoA epimerase
MNVTHIHHLNFIVRDITDGVRRFAALLGCPAENFLLEDLPGRGVKTARILLGETWLVLVSPVSEQGVPAEYLKTHGEGFFLLSLGVNDLTQAAGELDRQGISMATPEPRNGLENWRIWDIDPQATWNEQFQFCQQSE